jgi:A/G-specific adenine glycosylase
VRKKPRCDACPVRARCVARKAGRIAEFPAPRVKKALPLRKATWFVFRRNGEVLLERRPGTGLWGGLWTFPETRLYRSAARKLPPMEHGFTHFRLRIQPMLCEVGKTASRAEMPGRFWMDIVDAAAAAVPTPVRTLLGRLPAAR